MDINKQRAFEERIAQFAEKVVGLCKISVQDTVTRPIITQIVRSSTSVGANYMEANCASSRKDFANKIAICAKESRESKYWARMMRTAVNSNSEQWEWVERESLEFTLIFHKIFGSIRNTK
jgi:four helix bundle protein